MKIKDAYSYPEYCDIAYDWDRKAECDFIEECVHRYSSSEEKSILDIACGTGIHLREFARRGRRVMGLDISEEMITFVRRRAEIERLEINCVKADMKEFKTTRKYGCAVCMLDSFRFLLGEADILSHLRSVARAVKPGGLYILDLWMPLSEEKVEWEDISWRQTRQDITVDARYLQYPETLDRGEKTFEDEIIFKVRGCHFDSTVTSRVKTRFLVYEELKELARRTGLFECLYRFYNFDFDLKGGYNIKRTNVILKRT